MRHGIDVSYAQGVIDWTRVKTDFAILKCNTGVNFDDAQIINNAKGCHENCIPFGGYHWATLNKVDVVTDAKTEAADFIRLLKSLPPQTIIPALDIEEDKDTAKVQLSPNQIETWIQTFVQEMRSGGYPETMLYSYGPWLFDNLPKDHKLGFIPLWIAQYNFKESPLLPPGWTDWRIWQWTAKGRVWGINGDVDLNVMQ